METHQGHLPEHNKSYFPGERATVLQGIKVLEIGQVFAGPFAGVILSDLGADVIKIERLDGGDDTRRMGPVVLSEDALSFHSFNRGKRSVALDLKNPEALKALDRACAEADILIHNLRPGVPSKMGISAQDVCAKHEHLIYCEISAFGHVGPLSHLPGYEPLIQAFSGLSSINGGPDSPPARLGASVCDQGTGMWVALGALAMLEQRRRTGRGGILNASLLETALVWAGQAVDCYVNTGTLPARHASGHPGFAPYEAFDAADGPLLVCAGNDRLFAKLALVLRRPEWIDNEKYRTNRDRVANRVELARQIALIIAEEPRAHWLMEFEKVGVPSAAVQSVPEAVSHPQVQALDLIREVPGVGIKLTGLPISLNGRRPPAPAEGPRLGSDTDTFFQETLCGEAISPDER